MRDAEPAMCEKCKELDQKIEHYRELSQSADGSYIQTRPKPVQLLHEVVPIVTEFHHCDHCP
jgi:hypothetical protein